MLNELQSIRNKVNEAIIKAEQGKDYDRLDKLEELLRKIKSWEIKGCPEPAPFMEDLMDLELVEKPATAEPVQNAIIGSAVMQPAPQMVEPDNGTTVPEIISMVVEDAAASAPVVNSLKIEDQEAGQADDTFYSTEAAESLYKRLSARYLQAADDDAPDVDDLRTARKAVKAWIESGLSGSLPWRAQLEEWGVLTDSAPKEPAQEPLITPTAAASLMTATLDLSMEPAHASAGDVSSSNVPQAQPETLQTVAVASEERADQDSVPLVADSQQLMGAVPAVLEPGLESDAEDHQPPSFDYMFTDETQETVDAAPQSEEPGSGVPTPNGADESGLIGTQLPPAPDPDESLYDDFHSALAMFEAGQVYAAFEKLSQLFSAARGSLVDPIQSERERVGTRLQELTNERVLAVREYVRKAPNDMAGQRKKWEAVRDFNPQSTEAIQAIEALDRLRYEKETLEVLESIRRRVDGAERKKDLLEFSNLKGYLEPLIDRTGDSDELAASIQAAYQYWDKARVRVREILGVSSTEAVQGDTKAAYIKAIGFFNDQGVTLVPDVSGHFGEVNREFPKEEFLEKMAVQYINQLRTKAAERLATATKEQEQAPDRARRHIEEALAWLSDPNFREVDSRALAPEREKLKQFLNNLQEDLAKYLAADAKIKEGDDAANPSDRLRCYRDAQRAYPNYPEIAQRISRAREDIANYLATQMETASADAAQLAGKEDYQAAIKRLTEIRTSVSQEFPTQEEGTRLKAAFDQAKVEIDKYTELMKEYDGMMELLEQAKKTLDEYRQTSDSRLVNQARTLYQQLSGKSYARGHIKVEMFYADLTSQQDDSANWEDGQASYYDHKWKSAYESLRKVGDKSVNYASASQMAARARASMRSEAGKEYEDRKDWKNALTEYRGAVTIIEGDPTRGLPPVPTDAECEEKYQQAKEGIVRLAPIEERDKQKKALLDVSRNELDTAQRIDEARGSLDQRVEPISQFAAASKTLKDSLQQPSTLAGEMQALLSEIKIAWRETYLKTVKEVLALNVPDETLVNKACSLVRELKAEGLIYEREDQLTVLRLLCLQKDQEYRKLAPQIGDEGEERIILSSSEIDWSAVETNRRDLLMMADEIRLLAQHSPDVTERQAAVSSAKAAREALKNVARRRIKQEVTRRLEGQPVVDPQNQRLARTTTPVDTAREALRYLHQQLEETPWLSTDTSLIGDLIRLHWRTADWEGAQQAVSHFLSNNEITESVNYIKAWRESTLAAKAYAEGDMSRGDAYFDQLLNDHTFTLENLVDEIQKNLRAELFSRLVSDAQEAQRKGDDESLVLAADRYAQASRIDPGNRVVEAGLRDIGARLAGGLSNRCEQAVNFRVGRRKLEDAIRQADAMLKTLRSIQSVTGDLNLDDELTLQIDQAISDLSPRLAKWQRFLSFCGSYEQVVKEQLSAPEPIQVDALTSEVMGGWMADEIDAQVEQLEREARGDTDLIGMASNRRDQAQALRATMDILNRLVSELLAAVKAEEFRAVIESTGKLEQAWQAERAREPRWDGLSDLIHKDFSPWFSRGASDLRSHRSLAELQQKNYEAWAGWAQEVSQASEQVESGAQKINTPLESLKEELSMAEIIDVCRAVIKAATVFEERIDRSPKEAPLSAKSQAQKDRVREGLKDELAGCKARAEALRLEVQAELRRLDPELIKLRKALDAVKSLERKRKGGGSLPDVSLQPSVRQLKVCMEIDPCHLELIQTRQYLTGLGAVIRF